jgi:GNAT superfamily N-acetyltransferase
MPFLFSYGTLQQDSVQLSTFGRRLAGRRDELVGFERLMIHIDDPQFVAASGQSQQAIVRFNGRADSRVSGTVLEVTADELASADRYEPPGYTRIATRLASGTEAWVYADAGQVTVRLANPDDASALAALTVQLGYDVDAASVARRLSRILADSDARMFVAEVGGVVAGRVHAAIAQHLESDPFVTIGGMVVDERFRGRGVGRALMQRVEAWAAERGCGLVRLSSSITRTGAHRFYEQLGYRHVKTQHAFARTVGESTEDDLSALVPRVADDRKVP